jgi:hypothetical protein
MSAHVLAERIAVMTPRYEQMFAERGDVAPTDPLEFHLYHLALYWQRLVGFCSQDPSKTEGIIDTDLGACVAVGSEFAHKLIDPRSPVVGQWQHYWNRAQIVLQKRPVTLQDVEAASQAFGNFLAEYGYNPPRRSRERGTFRTIGCYLKRHGLADEKDVIQKLAYLRRGTPNGKETSPHTDEQVRTVTNWKKGV